MSCYLVLGRCNSHESDYSECHSIDCMLHGPTEDQRMKPSKTQRLLSVSLNLISTTTFSCPSITSTVAATFAPTFGSLEVIKSSSRGTDESRIALEMFTWSRYSKAVSILRPPTSNQSLTA
eukprot:m.77163 g.77163  ORF g.77163 m.77163 type:complete len:121 (-) comp12606_c0_seq5:240-602(-)